MEQHRSLTSERASARAHTRTRRDSIHFVYFINKFRFERTNCLSDDNRARDQTKYSPRVSKQRKIDRLIASIESRLKVRENVDVIKDTHKWNDLWPLWNDRLLMGNVNDSITQNENKRSLNEREEWQEKKTKERTDITKRTRDVYLSDA